MADMIPICTGDLSFIGNQAVCNNGTWRTQPLVTPFDPSQLDPVSVSNAFGNGFIVMGVPLLVILMCRIIINAIRGKQ